ncbi:hypothetical protein KY329_01410 [Candidatus Woesearchaeota archaeon]|nr:hypothetical protein [Candidatus Woesearchaeota archaeon]
MIKAVKKNLLDLTFNKYLQFYNTCIIILFSYCIGLMLALLTKQIDLNNFIEVLIVADISMFFVILMIMIIIMFKRKMKYVLNEIQEL